MAAPRRKQKRTDRVITGKRALTREVFKAASKGLIQWTSEEFHAANEYVHENMRPDRSVERFEEPSVQVDLGDGAEEIVLNRYIPEYPLAQFLIRTYGWPTCMAHFFRFLRIIEFISTYRPALCQRRWLIPEGQVENIDSNLIEALCALPFSRAKKHPKGSREWEFDFNEVVARTMEIAREPPGSR